MSDADMGVFDYDRFRAAIFKALGWRRGQMGSTLDGFNKTIPANVLKSLEDVYNGWIIPDCTYNNFEKIINSLGWTKHLNCYTDEHNLVVAPEVIAKFKEALDIQEKVYNTVRQEK